MPYAQIGQIVTGTTAVLLLAIAGYGFASLRYKVPGTTYFVALAAAAATWSFGYCLEKGQTVVEGFLMAAQVEYLGMSFIPALWLMVALSWMEQPLARSWTFRSILFGLSSIPFLLVLTNDLHHWWYTSIVPTGNPGFARFSPGPLYRFFVLFYFSTFLLSTALLLVSRKGMPQFRRKAAVIMVANFFPVVFSAAFQLGFRPGGLDPTIFSLVPSFLAVAWGLFRHEFIRIVPIAREAVVECLEQAVLVIDDQGRLIDHNAAARPILPYLNIKRLSDSTLGDEVTLPLKEGSRIFRIRRSPIRETNKPDKGTVLLLTDVTEERRLLDELAHQARHDALTGLPNRRHFVDHAQGEITRASRHAGTVALVLFDLDWFKTINDRFGHAAGDRVLRSIVDVVGSRLRPYDLLARVGGEEFAVLMPEAQPVEAREAAERWRMALETTPQVFPGAVFPVTASFGVATLNDLPIEGNPEPREILESLMGLADKALYQAKADGRNRVC